MIKTIIAILWLLLPAGIANMSPVLFKWVPFLNYPVDFNLTFRNRPLFGQNKTYRGFFFGIILAVLTVYIQKIVYAYNPIQDISLVNYAQINIFLLGFLLGFGALFGDLTKSFFKRQMNIQPGKSWFPFDQIDWILGSLIFLNFYIAIGWKYALLSVIVFGLLHPAVNLIGYFLCIKKNKF